MEIALAIVAAVLCGLFLLGAYRQGLKDGLRIKEDKEPEKIFVKKEREAKPPKLDERTEKILRNIDNYDGTSTGQEKI